MRIPGGSMQELVTTTRLIKDVSRAKSLSEAELNGEMIFDWAKRGDTVCRKAISYLVRHLADGIVNIVAVLNPEMIILGGGIMAQQEYLRPLIDRELQEKLAPNVYAGTQVEFAKLKNDAGMIGALYNFLSQEK